MISSIDNNRVHNTNNTNFKAIVPVKMVVVNGNVTRDPKQIKSAINHFVNILLKEDKLELKNSTIKNDNMTIRKTFKEKVFDYFIPLQYLTNSRKIGGFYGQKIRILEGLKSNDYFVLTGKDADAIDVASCKIKLANINKNPDELETAKQSYGRVANSLEARANYDLPRIIIHGKKEKSGKITPEKIEF